MSRFLRTHFERRRLQERGAAAIVLAVFVAAVMVPLGALGVDIGSQRVARGDAQAAADTIALDLARQLGNAATSGSSPTGDFTGTAHDAGYSGYLGPAGTGSGGISAEEGNLYGSHPSVNMWLGYIDPNATFISNQARGCGSSSPYDSYFQSTSSANKPANAVLVTVSSSVGFHFYPGTSGSVCRSAVASTLSATCVDIGTYTAALNADNSVLAPLLDGLGLPGLGANLAGYQGLANATVNVNLLNTYIDEQLANGQGIDDTRLTAGELAQAEVRALQASGDTVDASFLSGITGSQAFEAIAATPINLGTPIADVTTAGGVPVDGTLNVLDLLGSSLAVADGKSLASTAGLGFTNAFSNALGLNVNAPTVKVLDYGTKQACGIVDNTKATSAHVTTSQVAASVSASTCPVASDGTYPLTCSAPSQGILSSTLQGLGLAVGPVSLSLNLNVDQATATLGGWTSNTGWSNLPSGVQHQVTCNPDTIPVTVDPPTLTAGGSDGSILSFSGVTIAGAYDKNGNKVSPLYEADGSFNPKAGFVNVVIPKSALNSLSSGALEQLLNLLGIGYDTGVLGALGGLISGLLGLVPNTVSVMVPISVAVGPTDLKSISPYASTPVQWNISDTSTGAPAAPLKKYGTYGSDTVPSSGDSPLSQVALSLPTVTPALATPSGDKNIYINGQAITDSGLLGAVVSAVGSVQSAVTTVANSTLGTLANSTLTPLLSSTVTALDSALAPVLKALGITLPGADVYVEPKAICNRPQLK